MSSVDFEDPPMPEERSHPDLSLAKPKPSEIAALIRSGALVPVAVFGGDTPGAGQPGVEHCEKCGNELPWSFGLCDRFSKHTPGGSDCNRAEFFLLRPNDLGDLPQDMDEIRAALDEVLDE